MSKYFLVTALSLASILNAQQPIPNNFFGQNAWLTWFTAYTGPSQATSTNDHFVQKIAQVKASGAKYCRIGGNSANILGNTPGTTSKITRDEILFLVIKIRSAGMEPIIQVPYLNLNDDNSQLAVDALNAADIVNFINNVNVSSIPGGRVSQWIIANEPDEVIDSNGDRAGYNYNENTTSSPTNIAKYIKQFAIEMRKVDPYIKIAGPELSQPWHHFFFSVNSATFGNFTGLGLLDGTSITNPANNTTNDISGLIGTIDELGNPIPASIQNLPYLDQISFHYYGTATDRSSVVNNIHSTADDYKVKKALINLSAACSSPSMITKRTFGTSYYPLKVAITEANLKTDIVDAETNSDSFLRGQWWCDFMGLCLSQGVEWVNMWSSVEPNFGMIKTDGTQRPTYYHFKEMADNFSGNFFSATINEIGSSTPTDIKAFAAKSGDRIAVMILNQRTTGSLPFKVRLDNSGTPAMSGLDISFPMTGITSGANHQSTYNIPNQSTVLLLFNCKGAISQRIDYTSGNSTPQSPNMIGAPLIGQAISWTGPLPPIYNSAPFVFSPSTTGWSWTWQAPCGPLPSGNAVTLYNCACPNLANTPTTYTFTVQDPIGCTTTQEFQLTCSGSPIPSGTPTNCQFFAYIDLDLANGVYFISISNQSNETTVKKLVITK